ncbi:MAG: lipase family protein [Solirubrobacteraceae bacterium]|nr:lipase family protein [Patulibacter sp.]
MYRILKSRFARLAAASATGLVLLAPALPVSPAKAAVSPAIDRSFGAPTPNADADPFYTPPSPLPTGNPGDIIRARPALAGPPTARKLANAYQVMYLSTDALGQPDAVTGTILVPKAVDASTAPVVGFAPGTTGPAFRCTVSRFINSGAFYEQPAVNDMLKAGYAVAVTDYEGYHENPDTTYITGKSMGPAVLDAVRAAERLPEAGLSSTPKVLIRGYSQGGGAAMWAGQMAPTYAPEQNVIGVSGGGVPADLIQVAVKLQGSDNFGFLLNALIGLNNAYPELDLDSYLSSDTAKSTLTNMNANDCTVELLQNYKGQGAQQYFTKTPFLQPTWMSRLKENTLGSTPINVPVFEYHGTQDTIVAYNQGSRLHDQYCALGMNVTWKTYDVGHITGVARGNPDVMQFMKDRVAGLPAVSNCPTPTGATTP